jgi:predicted RNA-binding protein associated with RNAse of E/G family
MVLGHYAFADRWFKVNVTADGDGKLVETGAAGLRFAYNCDVVTPMRRVVWQVWSVDLLLDVLVRHDTASYAVTDEDQLEAVTAAGVLSDTEVSGARAGLAELVELIESDTLRPLLDRTAPITAVGAPRALELVHVPVPGWLYRARSHFWGSAGG